MIDWRTDPSVRPYQRGALEAVATTPARRGIVAIPTGTGKGWLSGLLPDALGTDRVLYLAHAEELIVQLHDHVKRALGRDSVSVEMADSRATPMTSCVVASVPTLTAMKARRLRAFEPGRFDAIVVDECHHACASTWLSIWQHFGLMDEAKRKTLCPERRLVGLTATPGRGDGVGLHNVFDEITYQYELGQAIEDGWLVPIRAWAIESGASLDGVAVKRGEYAKDQLAAVVGTADRCRVVVEACAEHAQEKRTLVFAVNVDHAKALASFFGEAGREAKWVAGAPYMSTHERRATIEWFRATPGAVLTNVQILGEGVDIRGVEAVVMAAPTRSATRYAQRLGRGTRLADGAATYAESVDRGKAECLLLDICDTTEDVGRRAVRVGDIFGAPLPAEDPAGRDVREVAAEQQERCAFGVVQAALTGSREVDLFAAMPAPPAYCGMRWLGVDGHRLLSLPNGARLRVRSDALDLYRVELWQPDARAWRPPGRAFESERAALLAAESWARRQDGAAVVAADARWRDEQPTAKQIRECYIHGLPIPPANATRGQVSQAIDMHRLNCDCPGHVRGSRFKRWERGDAAVPWRESVEQLTSELTHA